MKKIYIFIVLLIMAYTIHAQPVITGKVSNENGNVLAGVEFYLTEACIDRSGVSDSTGNVIVTSIPKNTAYLFYRYSGDQEYFGSVNINGNTFDLVISKNNRVIYLGNGLQTSDILSTQSAPTINRDELLKSSEVNVAKSLYGQLPGLFVMQPNGIFDSPGLQIRGRSTFGNNNPLVMVDGFERDLDYFSIDEIESVTVLKDAFAATLYGVRGANGVIVVTTRRGNIGRPKITVSYNNNQYSPFRQVEMAKAPAYASALNEALVNDGLPERYSSAEIAAFESGDYPYAYPDVNWKGKVFNSRPTSHLLSLNVQGGTERVKYFTSVSYNNSGGYYKGLETDAQNDHMLNNLQLNIKGNVDVQVTNTTLFSVGLLTHLNQQREPGVGADLINRSVYDIPSAAFPVYSGEDKVFASNSFFARNPVAMVNYAGFNKSIDQALFFDSRLRQDLSAILPGLTAEAAISSDFQSLLKEGGRRNYKYDILSAQIVDGNVKTSKTSFSEDTPMDYSDSISGQFINTNIEGKLSYSRSTSYYRLNTSLIYEQNRYFSQGRNNTEKRQAYKAFSSMVLGNKYLIDAVINYAGSAKLPEGDRFRLYPAISAAWIVSNEPFFGNAEGTSLKVRGSYGISGSDLFSHDLYRANFRGGGSAYFSNTISSYGSSQAGLLPTLNLNYETAHKADFGFDLSLFNNKLNFITDLFYENRSNILVPGSKTISGVLGLAVSNQVDGIIKTKGFEAVLSWQNKIRDFEYAISGNFAFARAKVVENGEGFLPYDYLSKKGNSLNAMYGLESIGFFSSDADIKNSPIQVFSEVRPGDIKYKDQNGDHIIDELDVIKTSNYGSIPEIYYGLNIHLKYKRLGFYALLQGVANRSIYTNTSDIFFPLQNNTNISTYYLEQKTRWTPTTATQADVPRLTTLDNANNFRVSDLWVRNASYLKLRNIEVSYDLTPMGFKARFFVRGANLFSLDKLKEFDPENYSIGYPSLSSYTLGIQINL